MPMNLEIDIIIVYVFIFLYRRKTEHTTSPLGPLSHIFCSFILLDTPFLGSVLMFA